MSGGLLEGVSGKLPPEAANLFFQMEKQTLRVRPPPTFVFRLKREVAALGISVTTKVGAASPPQLVVLGLNEKLQLVASA